jgi:hypothetical protein
MRRPVLTLFIVATLFWAVFWVLPAWPQADWLPLKHPQEGDDLRRCSECHVSEPDGFPFQRYEHTPFFGNSHRLVAVSSQRVCEICHQPSFCSDCHGASGGLKP